MIRTVAVCRPASWLAALTLAAGGCASSGPGVIPRDRVNYQEALSSSSKSQTLLNVVRLRYADPPIFLEVASIVNSYTWQAGATVGATLGDASLYNLSASGIYWDRPTITYNPVTGEKFTRSVLKPLDPESILSLVQAGYPVDAVFRMCVKAINGVYNQSGSGSLRRPADPSFLPLIEALRRIQASGSVGLRLEKLKDDETAILVLRAGQTDGLGADRLFVAQSLRLTQADEYPLVSGVLPMEEGEIAILTRSMLEILGELGADIDVPEKDIEEQRVVPPPAFDDAPALPPLLRVRCGAELPVDAYAATQYRGHWFWIDDRDIASKRVFGFLTLLFSLADTEGNQSAPLLTIPAG